MRIYTDTELIDFLINNQATVICYHAVGEFVVETSLSESSSTDLRKAIIECIEDHTNESIN